MPALWLQAPAGAKIFRGRCSGTAVSPCSSFEMFGNQGAWNDLKVAMSMTSFARGNAGDILPASWVPSMYVQDEHSWMLMLKPDYLTQLERRFVRRIATLDQGLEAILGVGGRAGDEVYAGRFLSGPHKLMIGKPTWCERIRSWEQFSRRNCVRRDIRTKDDH